MFEILYVVIKKNVFQGIHDQEFEVESLKLDVAKARDALAKAKLMLRESMKGEGWY